MALVSYPANRLCAYPLKGKLPALSAPPAKQVRVFNVRAANNSGSAISVGLLRQLVYPSMRFLKLVSGVYTDVTTSIGSAVPIFSGTANDGFAIQTTTPSGLIGVTISTQQTGGVYAYQYWNGTAFTAITTIENPTDFSAAGDAYIVFRPPYDWVPGGTSVPNQNAYTVRIVSTTGPAGAVSANNLWVGEFLELYSGVANNAMVQVSFPPDRPFVLEGSQGLFPYFSTTNAANQFGSYYVAE